MMIKYQIFQYIEKDQNLMMYQIYKIFNETIY